jgi:hypothetical protein
MIIVIVHTEHNEKTGRMEQVVSHGIDPDTGKTIVLPQDSPEKIGAVFDHNTGEWLIPARSTTPGMASKARPR